MISLITNLHDLHISSDLFRYPDFRNGVRHMIESRRCQTLQRSDFCVDLLKGWYCHIHAARDWDETLLAPLGAPEIKSISAVTTLRTEVVRQLRVSSITQLVLHHCQVEASDFSALLAATPKLTHLVYHAVVDYAWFINPRWRKMGVRVNAGLDPLFDALHHVRDTLTELVASQKFVEDSCHFQPEYAQGHEPSFRQRDELSKLAQLRKLSIPYACLLGWTRKEECQNWDWKKLLPPSLREITLSDQLTENSGLEFWTDESLIRNFSGLLRWFATCRQGRQTLSFNLDLLRAEVEFDAAARNTLSELCKAHDIECSIQKQRADMPKPPNYNRRGTRGRGRFGRGAQGGSLPMG